MRVVVIALMLLGALVVGCAPTAAARRDGTQLEEMIASLERARFAAMVARDTAALRSYLAPDLVYTHSSGAVEGREEFLLRLANGQLDYTSIEPVELRVNVLGQSALINGRANLVVGTDRFSIRYLDVWARRDGGWQMVAWQSTRLP